MPDEPKKSVRIQPIEYAVFCDYASMSMDGKVNLVGIFDRIMAEQVPAMHPQMFVVSKILIPKGKHNISFALMQEDKVLAKSSMEKEVEKPLISHMHFWGIQGLKIETWENIELQILFEGKQVLVKRLPIVKVEKKGK
ncbi:MAG: hypothetical protein WC777_03210 [Candidatus Gracilibacteria bacterium]|jgi:hypothetical protein